MSTAAAAPPPATGGTAGATGTGRAGGRTAKVNWTRWLVGIIVGLAVLVALALLFMQGQGNSGAAQTTPPAVQLQPAAGGQPATTAAGVASIIPPPSPLEVQLGDIKNLDRFVQDRYVEIKNEADKQRAVALQTAGLYQAQRLNVEAVRRTTR